MAGLITDLVQVKRLGEQKRDENEAFRRFMKSHGIPDRKLRRIAGGIEEQIDCTQCANCCRVAAIPLRERDVEHLSKFFRISPQAFLSQYAVEQPEEPDPQDRLVLKRNAEGSCIFLDGNDCTVYEARPSLCETFPHLVRGSGSIASRMWQFIDRACYCPIVYNGLEAFKLELRFRYRG